MRISFNWLSELVDLPEGVGPAELAERVTLGGLEVEGFESQAQGLDGVVVARVSQKEAHPKADRLSCCWIDAGEPEPLPVVCGAKNFQVGDTVALAKVGAKLVGGLEIKEAKLRGAPSRGMLCSERELGLSENHDGIWVLEGKAADAPLGTPLAKALGRDDVILEIGVTPNRPDALSHVGLAREVAAIFGVRMRVIAPTCAERGGPVDDLATVEIEDSAGCPRYGCRVVEGVKVGPSPDWLVARLDACGVRSINNVVDITNFVMMERGLPMHAFDMDRIARHRDRCAVTVRSARAGEALVTLDGKERKLSPSDLVIADPQKAIALAGVMGGAETEVGESTTRILLEAAYFEPSRIRRSARMHGIHSEASHRFERGCDPNGVRVALDRAASMLAELGGGTVARGAIDVYPKKIEPRIVALRPKRAASLLGIPSKMVGETAASKLLLSLGLEVAGREGDALRFRIPTFRPDLEREVDLIEELLRLIGYDKVETTLPARTGEAKGLYDTERHRVQGLMRVALEAAGYSEAVTWAFGSPETLRAFDSGDEKMRIRLRNPLGEEMSVMRTSLLPGLLTCAATNQRRQNVDIRLYEVASVFLGRNEKGESARPDDADGPAGGDSWAIEEPRVAGVLMGEAGLRGFDRRPKEIDFYDLKGLVESLCERIGFDVGLYGTDNSSRARVRFVPADEECPYLHPRAAARLEVEDQEGHVHCAGYLGEVHPDVRERFELKGTAMVFELDSAVLAGVAPALPEAVAPPRYPSVRRDFALVLDETIPAASLTQLLASRESVAKLLEGIEIFDVYTGEHVPAGKKSIALSVSLRASDRTLTDDEVSAVSEDLMSAARETFDAEIRA